MTIKDKPMNKEIARHALRGELWAPTKEIKEALVDSVTKALDKVKSDSDAQHKDEIEMLDRKVKAIDTMLGEEIERANKAEAKLSHQQTVLERVREALEAIESDAGNGDGWVTIQSLQKGSDVLHLLSEIMEKK